MCKRDCACISRIGARVRDEYTHWAALLAGHRCARRAARRTALQVRSRPYLLSASARRIIDLAVDLNWRRIGDVYWFTITPIDRASFRGPIRVPRVKDHAPTLALLPPISSRKITMQADGVVSRVCGLRIESLVAGKEWCAGCLILEVRRFIEVRLLAGK